MATPPYAQYTGLDALQLTNTLESKYLMPGVANAQEHVALGTITTTGGPFEALLRAPFAGTVTGAVVITGQTLAAAAAFVTFTITNKAAGAGSTAVLQATAANSTNSTGGSALTAYTPFPLTLSTTPANLVVAQFDCLAVTATLTGTLANTVADTNVWLIIQPAA